MSVLTDFKSFQSHNNTLRKKHVFLNVSVLPYLGMVGRFRGDDPHFLRFSDVIGSLFYNTSRSEWPSLSVKKNGLSLSHFVPEIFGPKVGLNFHQNVLYNSFYAFCIFFINFQSNWPLFSFILDLFDPSILQNLRSDFLSCTPTKYLSDLMPHWNIWLYFDVMVL